MHKIMHNKAPEYLTEVFNLIRDCSYNLKALQKTKTESLKKSLSYPGAVEFSSKCDKSRSVSYVIS